MAGPSLLVGLQPAAGRDVQRRRAASDHPSAARGADTCELVADEATDGRVMVTLAFTARVCHKGPSWRTHGLGVAQSHQPGRSARVFAASVRAVRAVVCHELGPPSLLRVEERPDPEAGADGVVVEVEAAGVNYVDALFVAGRYQIKPAVPFVPGTESAGRVIATGSEVSGIEVGQRVLVSAGLGGYASRVVARATAVTRIPDVLDAPRAATFTQSYSTSLFALRERAGVGRASGSSCSAPEAGWGRPP